ncbi:hypothetical protein GCM10029976_033380 [Kribbella albertanoniae]|uniref:Uncharacterized protein n=1 Tax=Kribbella albertanoniae TaxID=1266829 RepID=A0A4R4QJH3_9ACTN|nr:hypothetical protein [Kribbella albertanoniae]TDC35453.1 hypothetical protein E1261_00890 [Kribbella albertanoniae]
MQMRRILAPVLAVPFLGVSVGVAPAAQAADRPALKVTLSRGSVAVSSLNTVPVTVSVEGSYEDRASLYVQFKRISGTGPLTEFSSMELALVEGDGTPGVWRGTANVPSTASGTVEAAMVDALEFVAGTGTYDPAPVADPPKLVVDGVHVPKVTSLVTPKVVPYDKPWSVRYTITDSQTGKPYGTRLKALVGEEERCLEKREETKVLSDTSGNVVLPHDRQPVGDVTTCLSIPGNPGWISRLETPIWRPAAVSAAPSRTSAPVGTIVPVNGAVAYGSGCQVVLQRLYGATAWREVGSGKVRDSDRFTLNAQPSYKGNISYRVYLPGSGCYNKVPGTTKPFVIRGT